mgnify:CR=1 FL=1
MKRTFKIAICALLLSASACKDDDFLNVDPTNILTNQQAFEDPAQVLSILANLYVRQVDYANFDSWQSFDGFNESFPSENGAIGIVQNNGWGYGDWALYGTNEYRYIRELNLFIERATAATALSEVNRARFVAEARFLRANFYFEMAKRMGGVPLIVKPLNYDYSGNLEAFQVPRAKESEVYDFIISEAEAIKNDLPADPNVKSRASRGAALAMAARAALYAGSIAKYGVNTPQVLLPGGEVGIPANMATGYYTKALALAQEIISGNAGGYALYRKNPDLSTNFANLFLDKNNPETIFIRDYTKGALHQFTTRNQPRYGAEEEEGGRINPSLNFVEQFERLDNTFAPIPITDGAGNPIFYTNQLDAFAGRDARLAGTVILPGASFKGRMVDIFAGLQMPDGSIFTGDDRGAIRDLPDGTKGVQVVGFDGPTNKEFTAQTGFYLRKYVDPTAGAGSRGTGSEVPLIRYRYAEVLLNAAEAAFELNDPGTAATYMNEVRARAGLTTGLTAADITFNRIVHERRVELAFEGHLFYDLKRWRIAHIVFDGNNMTEADLLSNIGSATKRNTRPFGLLPYKVHNPGSPNHGKWIYKIALPSGVSGNDRFALGNYYSAINEDIISRNPKIVRQPNQ